MNFITSGTLAGLLSLFAAGEAASGHPHFAGWLGDPATASAIWATGSGLLGLVAGALKGLRDDAA
ncbi:MAG TPA: hypothetical protein VED87_05505 [Methylocystis sp.]|nr:hypothetical protein [Methylocystis sp.]